MASLTSTPFVIFDFRNESGLNERLVFNKPREIITATEISQVREALDAVERASKNGLYAAGFISYEAAPAFDPALAVHGSANGPLLWFATFDRPLDKTTKMPFAEPHEFTLTKWQPSVGEAHYFENVDKIRQAIARGETYQVNYTIRLRAELTGSAYGFYERLREAQRGPYCAYFDTGEQQILSASPELFFCRNGSRIVTRPMKGTSPRGRWSQEDDDAADRLHASAKDRAENVMIVDLLRNDLGRVAQFGAVQVTELFTIERYPTVLQMTSTVEANLRPHTSLYQVFTALFPPGSVTGAPKVSTTRLIAELEDSPRGVYCGSVGLIKPGGNCTFNVAIRTVAVKRSSGLAEYGVGGGVTWDSTARGEYDEARAKAALLTQEFPDFQLLETLRLESGNYALLDRHLDRLMNSAKYFSIPISPDQVKNELATHAGHHPDGVRRVRLLVSQEGCPRVESRPLEPMPSTRRFAWLAESPVSRRNIMLFHKTTYRKAYDVAVETTSPRVFDHLLWNEENELTEFTRGNLVAELDGKLLTPPLDCGLLPGTLRAELLDKGVIAERVISKADLADVRQLWFINSLRGWIEVELEPSPLNRDRPGSSAS